MSIINDNSELDKILETTNLDDYKLIDTPMEPDESLHELTGVRMVSASDTPSTSGLAPHKRRSRELCVGVDTCQESSGSSSPHSTCVCENYSRAGTVQWRELFNGGK